MAESDDIETILVQYLNAYHWLLSLCLGLTLITGADKAHRWVDWFCDAIVSLSFSFGYSLC